MSELSLSSRLGYILGIGILLFPQIVVPATITVGGACTLVDAVTAANTDTAVGSCTAGSNADEIVLTEDVVLTAVDNSPPNQGDNGLPVIVSNVTISGAGFTISRDAGAPDFRLLDVASPGSLLLRNTTLTGGRLDSRDGTAIRAVAASLGLRDVTVIANYSTSANGAVDVTGQGSSLTIVDSLVTQNDGSGVRVQAADTLTTISGSTLSENDPDGLFVDGNGASSVLVDDSSILDNVGTGVQLQTVAGPSAIHATTISGNSRGVEIFDADNLSISDSELLGNGTAVGGGVAIDAYDADNLTITGTTISGNFNDASGGSIIYTNYGTPRLVNSTVSGNSATGGYGQVIDAYLTYDFVIENSTITDNNVHWVIYGYYAQMDNSIVGGNAFTGQNCFLSVSSTSGNNFDDDGTCPSTSPIVPGVDFDTALADNGGPTETHALLAGSVAIDAAGTCGLTEDQRGFTRDAQCDSGAFEFEAPPPIGGSDNGAQVRDVQCLNVETSQSVMLTLSGEDNWSCSGAGLSADPSDRVRQVIAGRVNGALGGSVTGMSVGQVQCQNITQGGSVDATPGVGETSWTCTGLAIAAGDNIRMTVQGRAD